MRFVVLMGLAISLLMPASADELMSMSAFRDEMLKRISTAFPEVSFETIGPDTIKYDGPLDDDMEGQIFVDNSYQLYRGDPDDIDNIIGRIVDNFETFNTEEEVEEIEDAEFLEALILIVRPENYSSDIPDMEINFVSQPFVGDLAQLLAFDTPEALRFVTVEELEERGMSPDQVFPIAADNIGAHMGEVVEEPLGNLTILYTENGLGTSLPLLPGACASETPDHAFWIVDRESMLRADLENDTSGEILLELAYTAVNAMQNGYGMSTAIMTCIDGEWGAVTPSY